MSATTFLAHMYFSAMLIRIYVDIASQVVPPLCGVKQYRGG